MTTQFNPEGQVPGPNSFSPPPRDSGLPQAPGLSAAPTPPPPPLPPPAAPAATQLYPQEAQQPPYAAMPPSPSAPGFSPAAPVPGATPAPPPAAFPPAGAFPTQGATSPAPGFVPSGLPGQNPAPTSFSPPPSAAAPAPGTQPEPAAGAAKPTVSVQQRSGPQRAGVGRELQDGDIDINEALRAMIRANASDLHLTSGVPPMVRKDGGLQPLTEFPMLVPDSLQRVLYSILTQAQREKFEEDLELDFSYSVPNEARFRVNIYRQRDSIGAAFRVIPYEIKPLEALGIPEAVSKFAHLPRGLVLVTGPTGSGKSTTLASLIDLANRSRSGHIMTVEDPIEFLHKHKRSIVNQREVGSDTLSFQRALRHVLRQDPDIILIGELRDLDTISVALTAAETGHLVFATLHTQSASQTVDRIIDVFPPEQQGQVRAQLGAALQGVVCQTLLKRADGPGRAVAVEVMVVSSAIRNLIREGKTHQIPTALQAGASLGMQSLDQHLAELVKGGAVTYEQALEVCDNVEEFRRLSGRAGSRQ